MSKSSFNLLLLGIMFIAFGIFCTRGQTEDFEQHTEFAGGLSSVATIVAMDSDLGTTVEYKNELGATERATIETGWDDRLRVGQSITISYLPGQYDLVRWPDGRESVKAYKQWQLFFKGCIVFGQICLLFLIYKLFVRKESREGVTFTSGANASYSLSPSLSRLLFQGFSFVFFFGVSYAILHIWLFNLSGLPLATAQIIFGAFVAMFLLALWQMIVPKIGHPALKLDRQGFSIYDSGKIPWREISEIRIESHTGRVTVHFLVFFLKPGSKAGPLATNLFKTLNPPRMRLTLETVCWDQVELQEQLIRFALEGRDDDAGNRFRQSGTPSTGPITWPEERSGNSMKSKMSADVSKPEDQALEESGSDSSAQSDEGSPSNKGGYMGLGFHLGNH